MTKSPPSFQFYPSDLISDPTVACLKLATFGAWVKLLCYIHEENRAGAISRTADQFARMLGCTTPEIVDVIAELKATGTANISQRDETITVLSRRMQRDAKIREQWRMRQSKKRGHAPVTQLSQECPTLLHTSYFNTPYIPPGDSALKLAAKAIWEIYPAHRRGDPEETLKALLEVGCQNGTVDKILSAINALKDGDWKREGGKFVPGLSKWIKARGWESVVEVEPEAKPDPAGSEPRPPRGMKWKRDSDGELCHPMEAIPL